MVKLWTLAFLFLTHCGADTFASKGSPGSTTQKPTPNSAPQRAEKIDSVQAQTPAPPPPATTPTPQPSAGSISSTTQTAEVDAPIVFNHLPDTAAWTNCLKISVNGGPEVDLGCNRGATLRTATVKARAKPYCNKIRLNLYSNGTFNKSTQSPDDLARSFRIQKQSTNEYKVQCNDNSDSDFNDLNLTMKANGQVSFMIENYDTTCSQ